MSNSEILNKYLRKLTSLKQGVTTNGKAPHKPILQLTILIGLLYPTIHYLLTVVTTLLSEILTGILKRYSKVKQNKY